MQRLWQESELRAEAERNTDFADQMVGFAYMQRKTSVDKIFVDMFFLNGGTERGDPGIGHSRKIQDGKYGWPADIGKEKGYVPHIGKSIHCRERASGYPERDEHPTAIEVPGLLIRNTKLYTNI